MKDRKITRGMVSLMAKKSLKSSRMRNIFVMVTIALASALLMAILMFSMGQRQQTKNALSHRQQVSYYNLTEGQVERLKEDQRIACQVQVKEGILSGMEGFDVMPYYVSSLSGEIKIAASTTKIMTCILALENGNMPTREQEVALQAALLEKMGIEPAVGSEVAFHFYDGNTETFTVSGILEGGENTKQFPVFFSEKYARAGSQLKGQPFTVYAKLTGAEGLPAGERLHALVLDAQTIPPKISIPHHICTRLGRMQGWNGKTSAPQRLFWIPVLSTCSLPAYTA